MPEKRDVVVTGIGPVTPIGIGVDTFWEGLRTGRNGIAPISRFDTSDLPVTLAGRRDAKNRAIIAEAEFFDVIAEQRAKLERMKYDEERFFSESIPVLSDTLINALFIFFKTCPFSALLRVVNRSCRCRGYF